MKITVEGHISIPTNLKKVRNKGFWSFTLDTWHRLVSPYVPFETGNLDETIRIEAELMGGGVEYTVPYAHYIYEGKNLEFSKSRHPLATSHWDKAAEPQQKPKLIQSMQLYVDSGRLSLNE